LTVSEKNILLPIIKKIEQIENNEFKATYIKDTKLYFKDNKKEMCFKNDKKGINNVQSKLL